MGNTSQKGRIWSHEEVTNFLHSLALPLIPVIIEIVGSYIGSWALPDVYYKHFPFAEEVQSSAKSVSVESPSNEEGGDSNVKYTSKMRQMFLRNPRMVLATELRKHTGKVYSVRVSNLPMRVVSAGNDGLVIIWDALSRATIARVTLKSMWVMTCDVAPVNSPSDPVFTLSGGLDNMITIHSTVLPHMQDGIPQGDASTFQLRELKGHNGYVACARFDGPEVVLSASGDKTARSWDVNTGKTKREFSVSKSDVVVVQPYDSNTFAIGNCTSEIIFVDQRAGTVVKKFLGHESDLCGLFFPPARPNLLASASEDSTCRIWDISSGKEIKTLLASKSLNTITVTGVVLSSSCRTCYASCEDGKVKCFDVNTGNLKQMIPGHTERVASIDISGDGRVLATGSWDHAIKLWKYLDE